MSNALKRQKHIIHFRPCLYSHLTKCLNPQIDSVSGQSLRADELRSQSIQLAYSLKLNAGIVEGDVIGLCCENRLEFPVVAFAGILLGATIAPMNTSYTPGRYFIK